MKKRKKKKSCEEKAATLRDFSRDPSPIGVSASMGIRTAAKRKKSLSWLFETEKEYRSSLKTLYNPPNDAIVLLFAIFCAVVVSVRSNGTRILRPQFSLSHRAIILNSYLMGVNNP